MSETPTRDRSSTRLQQDDLMMRLRALEQENAALRRCIEAHENAALAVAPPLTANETIQVRDVASGAMETPDVPMPVPLLRRTASMLSPAQPSKTERVIAREETAVTLGQHELTIVVFGATGDLAKKKTFPAMFRLFESHLMPDSFFIFGYARSEFELEAFRDLAMSNVKTKDEQLREQFRSRIFYQRGQYDSADDFVDLNVALEKAEAGRSANRMFYLAIPPQVFVPVCRMIRPHLMGNVGFKRVVIEKPFGQDLKSSNAMTKQLRRLFAEPVIYRIDHYLGKEMVLNLLVLRFANIVFHPIWNRDYIRAVYISFKEDIGVEGRAGYFDQFGIIRDVMQNHLLQMLSLVAMEPPVNLSPEDVRDEKVKALRACRPISVSDTVVGQYEGYTTEPGVPADSITPTFAQCIVHVDNQRWDGVPFIMRCGKHMEARRTEIRVQFKDVPGANRLFGNTLINELVVRVQPNEAIYLKLATKIPGLNDLTELTQTELDLTYTSRFSDLQLPDAYERLILDVMRGDHTHFVRSDELEAAWAIFTPMLHELESSRIRPVVYPKGQRVSEADKAAVAAGFQRVESYSWPHL